MIPEYKLYHGSVLADIIDRCDGAVSIRECVDPGRLLNYILDDRIGLQIKYATARLRPWHFSFPSLHVQHLRKLTAAFPQTFIVLVCSVDGMATIPGQAVLDVLGGVEGGSAWLRVTRRKREMYRVFGPEGEVRGRFHTTTGPIAEALLIDRAQRHDLNDGDAIDVYSERVFA